ncbi:glycosyltransferase [Janthinobacterium sp. 17J80-10]|uniref:glycosyltransferase n=1 Tax=Janthinobacterium sp. 17J80-10 TaxID=2497863 RepID=UPI0019D70F11|nr:glycosyltransferase [Janthinobacterium sp. 17J80-10]
MSYRDKIHLLFVSHESWPTFRPDVAVLFGKYLPRLGVTSDLVTEHEAGDAKEGRAWGGGKALLCRLPAGRAGQHIVKTWHNLRVLASFDRSKYDAIQVRDMPMMALAGLAIARLRGVPFFYWMSFPQSEGQIIRAQARGPRAGMRYWFPLLQGTVGKWLLYRVVLPRTDHVFVQSRQMAEDVASQGIARDRMTAVPMGVDLEMARPEQILPSDDSRLSGKRVLVYLGALDRVRKIEALFEMLAIVRQEVPDVMLVLAGDTPDTEHRAWLQQEAIRLGVMPALLWTGWLPTEQAWRYVRAAEIGLSVIPRGFLLDCGSPTKAVEYMALGLPVVGNDNPDQALVVSEGNAGICVKLEPQAFASAVIQLLGNAHQRSQMALSGQLYVRHARSYDKLAQEVAHTYRHFFSQDKRDAA